MKQRFLNQKLGKRATHKAAQQKAKLHGFPARPKSPARPGPAPVRGGS